MKQNRNMKKFFITIIAALTLTAAGQAQTENRTFSVMTLNVDGLPGRLFFFDVNKDGPQEMGSLRISQYIAQQDCDIVALQENFNYRWEIWSHLFSDYQHDEWTGGILTEDLLALDLAHPQNIKLTCDGLSTLWKLDCQPTTSERVAWNRSFGKFSHDFDDIITKGFRRQELTLGDGTEVVVYNMHMDASSERDELLGNDLKDREARESQWIQLRQHILERLDSRPIIVVGDMNSYYHRDAVKQVFIDAIEATGRATVGDVWVEAQLGGLYPPSGSKPLEDETLDKVLYINPAEATTAILPESVEIDVAGYTFDGKPLGDHYPLIVRFAAVPTDRAATGISTSTSADDADEWFSVQGTRLPSDAKGLSISRSGQKLLRK